MEPGLRVAFVHDWLVSYRGGERVLAAMIKHFPEAPIHTLFYSPERMPPEITSRNVICPKGLNLLRPFRRALLPFYPAMVEALPLFDYDLVISTSSCVAKGALVSPHAQHISYVHSPMRYIWDQREQYLKGVRRIPLVGAAADVLLARLRLWDAVSAQRVTQFIANSQFVGQRIDRYYQRESTVIHPPVEVSAYQGDVPPEVVSGPYYLVAGALVDYKRVDLAIEACRRLGRKLVIAGEGPKRPMLQRLAEGSDCHFLRAPDQAQWRSVLYHARALLHPGVEDFGITAVEALASGTPLVALSYGGACDYLRVGENGTGFRAQTPEGMVEAIERFEALTLERPVIAATAKPFGRETFDRRFREVIAQTVGGVA